MQRSHVAHLAWGARRGARLVRDQQRRLASPARQLVSGFAIVRVLNNAARPYGDAAIAAIAIVQRVVSFGNYIQIGIGQGFQPVCGYNYGAGRKPAACGRLRFARKAAFGIVACVCVLTFAFVRALPCSFVTTPEVIRIATSLRCASRA